MKEKKKKKNKRWKKKKKKLLKKMLRIQIKKIMNNLTKEKESLATENQMLKTHS